jgi:hypothetical protein
MNLNQIGLEPTDNIRHTYSKNEIPTQPPSGRVRLDNAQRSIARLPSNMGTSRNRKLPRDPSMIWRISFVAVLFASILVACGDRTRHNCITQPTAPRCDTSTGATTP